MTSNENRPIMSETAAQIPNNLLERPEKKPSEAKLAEAIESNMEPDIALDEDAANDNPKTDPTENNGGECVDFSEGFEGQKSSAQGILDTINYLRYNCGMFVNNKNVQLTVVVLIGINSIMMGIGTYDFVKLDPEMAEAFDTVDMVFLTIFTVELFLQFVYHGWRLLLDGWLVFDLIIILTSWTFDSVQIIRAFRIFRALRLVTRIKIMKNLIMGTFLLGVRVGGKQTSQSHPFLLAPQLSSAWCPVYQRLD